MTLLTRRVCIALLLLVGCPALAAEQTVRLVIDYHDGVRKVFDKLPWKEGMTVRDAMDAAQSTGHGIRYEAKGSGETAFLTRIDDVQSQGARREKKNWVYKVNDKLAEKSFGVYKLKVGDSVQWTYEPPGSEKAK